MNPDSETYMLRSLAGQKAGLEPKPAHLPGHVAERVITLNKVQKRFLYLYQRFWQMGLKSGIRSDGTNAISEDSKRESETGAGIDIATPAKLFLIQLIENN
jgi:hypothetical protein